MHSPAHIGPAPWSHAQIRADIEQFCQLLDARPIRDNSGGMQAPHLFALWFMVRALQPTAIVESGVWKGQGTWLLRQACPEATIYCIDPNLERIEFRDDRAVYQSHDFAEGDWGQLDRKRTLLVFDDHANALQRVRQARQRGFRHLIFEDNYPASLGDCYSLKKVFAGAGFSPAHDTVGGTQNTFLGFNWARRKEVSSRVPPNMDDAVYLSHNLEVYSEFPPLFRPSHTRWGDGWVDDLYPTPSPLLCNSDKDRFPVLWKEALAYTWICYARLKG